jgi:lipoprotein Spr
MKNKSFLISYGFIFIFSLLASYQADASLNTRENGRALFNQHGSETPNNAAVRTAVLEHYREWEGVRYQWGGSSKKGIDCSAFVQKAFRSQFGVNLPRTTLGQKKLGQQISRKNIVPGDLIFFSGPENRRHVGIAIGNDRFVHASTSQGVTTSSLKNPYWNRYYRFTRRVISNDSNGVLAKRHNSAIQTVLR